MDVTKVLAERRRFAARERWPRSRLESFQRERLALLVEHASRHSAFYRALYGGPIDRSDVRLETLPAVTKAATMASFDRWVTDPRLRLESLERHLSDLRGDELYLGEYRVVATGGSTGQRGIFVFSRAEWRAVLGGVMRWSGMIGVRPRFPRRVRMAAVVAPSASHMSYRMGASIDVGVFATCRLSALQPMAELVAALNRHQPEVINAYPSVAALLAVEQLEGRLAVSPRVISTSSEMRTDEMTQRIREAWGVEPYNSLGLTETGLAALDCEHHQGLHVFEDACIVEVVDEEGRPVASGPLGARLLVTNLFNYTQPVIRFEITDLVAMTDDPCPCGRTLRRIAAIEGRSDDILVLPAQAGGTVSVHPIQLRSPLVAEPAVTEFQVVQEARGLDIRIALATGAEPLVIVAGIEAALAEKLRRVGAAPLPTRVSVVERIERDPGAGKLKLVRAFRAAP